MKGVGAILGVMPRIAFPSTCNTGEGNRFCTTDSRTVNPEEAEPDGVERAATSGRDATA